MRPTSGRSPPSPWPSGKPLAGAHNVEALRIAPVQAAVHLLEDVASLPELAQAPLPVLGQEPAARRDPVRETETLELLEPPDEQCRFRTPAPLDERPGIDAPFGGRTLDLTIERRQPLLVHLPLVGPLDLALEPGTEALGRQLLSAPPQPPGDVRALHPQLPALAANAADDDVRVRVLGVMVIHRRPLDGPSEVSLDALHQVAHVVGEVEVASVLRRHDEPQLMPLADARLLEGLPSHGALGAVEHTRRAVLLDPVALDVPQVPGRRLGAPPTQLLHVRFDHHSAGPRARAEAGGRRQPPGLGTQTPVASEYEPRDTKGSRYDPLARAIGAADTRPEDAELVVSPNRV